MKKLLFLLVAVLCFSMSALAQTRIVKGTVIDATTDEPMIGVRVVPAGSQNGVLTDYDGNFAISVANSVKELEFSYVGYKTVKAPVQANMDITMEPAAETLENIVVTGYGSGKKLGSMVGSVAVVGGEALENTTTPSFVDALQGKVAGLSIMSNSGDPSSTANVIRLRGVNSLNSDITPLFILDGAPVTETVFSTLNPADIQSITVLKDAASVAIYGARAANGVIVITSKRGKYAEKAEVRLRMKYGWSQMVSDKVDMMGSADYIKYRDLIGKPVTDEQRYAAETLGISTDWRSEIFNSAAPTYSVDAAISGGSEKMNYYLSMNHLDQEGIISQSGMRRTTMRVSLSSRATDWLQIGMQANLGFTKYQTNHESTGSGVILTSPMTFARMALPMDSPYYWTKDDAGNVVWGEKSQYLHFSQLPTPAYMTSTRDQWRNRSTINANVFEQLTPIQGLTIRAQQAIDAYDTRLTNVWFAHEALYTPMGDSYEVDDVDKDTGMVPGFNQQSFSRYYQFTYTNTAEYRFRVGGVHNITALLGQESIIKKSEGFYVYSQGQSDPRQWLLSQGTSVEMANLSQSIAQITMNSWFLSASYNYADKYFLDLNFRSDGSSRFAPGHRWANFWSAGVMWDLKQESFLKKYTWLNRANFNISYGTTGNSEFANYAYFGLVGSGPLYNKQPSIGIAQPSNVNLSWESVAGLDVGLKVGLFNKLDLELGFYNKNTTDMLVEIPYSMTTGMGGNWGNIASMRNTGVDIQFEYRPIQTRDWLWAIHGNFNYNRNMITKLFNDLDEVPFAAYGFIYKKGHVANEFYNVTYAGVDPRDGKQLWYTREGNLTKQYNEERDAVCQGKSQYAPYGGGFGTQLSWKNLSLLADFTWAIDKYMINNDLYFIENNNFATSYNQTTKMLNVWTAPIPGAPIPCTTVMPATGQTLQIDSRYIENASFLRLKSLTLQYALPRNLLRKAKLTDISLHFTGRNLLTFTGYTGYDPEPETNVVAFFYPNTRQYEFGIDVSF